MWSGRDGVQSHAADCSLSGKECGPDHGERGTSCGPKNALIAVPTRFDCRPLHLATVAESMAMLGSIDALRWHGLHHAPITHPQRSSPMHVTLQLVKIGRASCRGRGA